MHKNLKKLVLASMLVAISVVLTRVLAGFQIVIGGAQVRLNLGFIPIMYAGYLIGPLYGMSVGAVSDIVGFFVNPMGGGGYFPGFTVTSAVVGLLPGLIRGKLHSNTYVVAAVSLLAGIIASVMNSMWLALAFGSDFRAIFIPRIIVGAISSAVNAACMYLLLRLKLIKNV